MARSHASRPQSMTHCTSAPLRCGASLCRPINSLCLTASVAKFGRLAHKALISETERPLYARDSVRSPRYDRFRPPPSRSRRNLPHASTKCDKRRTMAASCDSFAGPHPRSLYRTRQWERANLQPSADDSYLGDQMQIGMFLTLSPISLIECTR